MYITCFHASFSDVKVFAGVRALSSKPPGHCKAVVSLSTRRFLRIALFSMLGASTYLALRLSVNITLALLGSLATLTASLAMVRGMMTRCLCSIHAATLRLLWDSLNMVLCETYPHLEHLSSGQIQSWLGEDNIACAGVPPGSTAAAASSSALILAASHSSVLALLVKTGRALLVSAVLLDHSPGNICLP